MSLQFTPGRITRGAVSQALAHRGEEEILPRPLPTEWICRNLTISGKPITYKPRPWWLLPTNLEYTKINGQPRKKTFVLAGRQVEKTTSLANKIFSEICSRPWLQVLYVAPSRLQVSEFSYLRIDATLDTSPAVRHLKHKALWSVTQKVLRNYSRLNLRWAYRTADRSRGIPADKLVIDEIQDVWVDTIPVLQETLSHCNLPDGPSEHFSGTPKTFDNAAEIYWSQHSTQNEWMVRCGCGHWNLLADKSIGKLGLVCVKCSRYLNPMGEVQPDGTRKGVQWARHGPSNAEYEGFRIPQLLLPYSYSYDKKLFQNKWQGILHKRDRYPRYRFYNEVLGISYDSGQKPITRDQLRACCMPGERLLDLSDPDLEIPTRLINGKVFSGVDWGTGDPSKTAHATARFEGNVFEVFYLKRYIGSDSDPDTALPRILSDTRRLKTDFAGLDWGFGWGLNSQFRNDFGWGKTLVFNHSNQRARLKYDESARVFITNRTQVMSEIYLMIQEGRLRFRCSWEDLLEGGFAQDILANSKEESREGKLLYNKPPGTTDDTLHAIIYAYLSSHMVYGSFMPGVEEIMNKQF